MSTCPHHKLRADLPPLTERLKKLPVDERGYPVPFFVAWVKGKPEFRAADPVNVIQCITQKLCWVCGHRLRSEDMAFVIGPMCALNRINGEPPSHLECAQWSVLGCPFLSKPQMVRREDDFTRAHKDNVGGVMIDRNPGVTLIWKTRSYKIVDDGGGRRLYELGPAESVSFWRLGRAATRAEIKESIDTGLPLLLGLAPTSRERAEAEVELMSRYRELEILLPPI